MGSGGRTQTLSQRKAVKRTVKYLAHAPDAVTVQAVLRSAPSPVIRAIANAALNAREGDVHLTPAQKRLFRAYARTFDVLCDRQLPLDEKRRHLLSRGRPVDSGEQTGGALPIAAVVVPLLASVLGSLGSSFIARVTGQQES